MNQKRPPTSIFLKKIEKNQNIKSKKFKKLE